MGQMENTVNRLLRGWHEEVEHWSIPLDVVQKTDEVEVKASLPGIKPGEIDIAIEDNVLTIKAESAAENETEEAGYLVRERSFGSFFRALRLPDSVDPDKVSSNYEHGVLKITLPKAEEKKRKQIKVNVTSGAKDIESSTKAKK
jgi:HSP20 family protein